MRVKVFEWLILCCAVIPSVVLGLVDRTNAAKINRFGNVEATAIVNNLQPHVSRSKYLGNLGSDIRCGTPNTSQRAFLSPKAGIGSRCWYKKHWNKRYYGYYSDCTTLAVGNMQNVAAKRSNSSSKHEPIIGGDIDTPPGILHTAETPEMRNFTDEMWKQQVPLREAVERLNLLEPIQPDSVLDNFMYGKSTQSVDELVKQENESETGHNDEEVIGYVAPTEYVDEKQYLAETQETKPDRSTVVDSPMEEDMSDDEDDTGIYEVNYSALNSSERQLVLTLMYSKLEEPESHEEILKEMLAGDMGGLTEKQCRTYFDKFRRIGDILLELNKTVQVKPLQTDWIPEVQARIRDFVSNMGHEVTSIKWTEHSLIIALKGIFAETRLEKLHEALAAYLRTDAGADICPGIKNIGILLCMATPDEGES
ncbi:uncharacterized protein BXIN_0659 [Babesia sp. Xinjiang]|uniref:uncharacterized protein n=1 Tax=Babesia sp. Xinjiang TaxID=462227 RepID=UPI000A252203|nr:uncharacterized protein BXIN_0659 [Babesia sp. Xinjiang]ORM41770.1 hypothetical protein BXIN_0659 [Babesia sp. Xinjiang]